MSQENTEQSNNVKIRSRAGILKPISRAQVEALRIIEAGIAYYKPWYDWIMGVRQDTFEVLERNGLVEVSEEPANPQHKERFHRFPIVLTDDGRAALKRVAQ